MSTRLVVTAGYVHEAKGGGRMRFGAGRTYLLPDDLASELLDRGVAYVEGDPPQASDGTTFRGAGAFKAVGEHEERLVVAERRRRGPLAGVDFASDEAAEAAADLGFSASDFDGLEPSGKTGYTVADVNDLGGS